MATKAKKTKSPLAKKTESPGKDLDSDKVLEKEFMPLVATYVDGHIQVQMKYLAGKQPCKGISAKEVHNAALQLVRICRIRRDVLSEEELVAKVNALLATFTKMDPKDSVEAGIIIQMIALQELTMNMAERAFVSDEYNEIIDQCVNRVSKLTRSYASLADSFTKYRTKGQQKITVQHVNVENGAQAIVGNVNQGGGGE